jgi:hypothetical protein
MTEYYVDGGAAGTGDGLSPTNAFVDILSVPWADASRAWVRRTHNQTFTQSQFVGPNSFNNAFSKWSFLIGWPEAGAPFYDDRPAAGVSASWDSDNPSTQAYSSYGFKMPTMCMSNNTFVSGGFLPGRGIHVANFYMVNCGGLSACWFAAPDHTATTIYDNVMPLFNNGPLNALQAVSTQRFSTFRKLIFVGSSASTSQAMLGSGLGSFHADKVLVHSATTWGAGIVGINSGTMIGVIENYSNSVAYGVMADGNMEQDQLGGYVRRMIGVAPVTGDVKPGPNNGRSTFFMVDDYFGNGPLLVGNPHCYTFRQATSLECLYNSNGAVVKWATTSVAVTIQYFWGQQAVPGIATVRKKFDVVSGTPITVSVPTYCDSTGVHSLASGRFTGALLAKGCDPITAVNSNIFVGSPSSWAGSLIAGGSAYLMKFTWTPIETGNVFFEFRPGGLTQPTSGAQRVAYILWGEPF